MGAPNFDYIRVSMLPNIGINRGKSLLDHFGSFEEFAKADIRALQRVKGIQQPLAISLHSALREERTIADIDAAVEKAKKICDSGHVSLLTIDDSDYPAMLRKIYDPPLFIFLKGTFTKEDEKALAIVGTRQPTDYGRQVTAQFAESLASAGVTIVSGLALGIDTIAHHTALQHGGRTIAVMGSGIDTIYPFTNRTLSKTIAENGCLISEFLPGTKPDAPNFPRRNRIISGLSIATIVAEAGLRSGATLTAQMAFDQNREVFAIPGSIYNPKSEGTNELIRTNVASPVGLPDHIFEALDILKPDAAKDITADVQLNLAEGTIINALGNDPVHVDALGEQTGMRTSDILIHLLQLEFKGLVRQLPGKYFTLATR